MVQLMAAALATLRTPNSTYGCQAPSHIITVLAPAQMARLAGIAIAAPAELAVRPARRMSAQPGTVVVKTSASRSRGIVSVPNRIVINRPAMTARLAMSAAITNRSPAGCAGRVGAGAGEGDSIGETLSNSAAGRLRVEAAFGLAACVLVAWGRV